MELQAISSHQNDQSIVGGLNSSRQTLREKSKRPQLSCNSCRARKCDRVQPCTACSLHQIADSCQYDLTESERHPILQAEALREKDKEIARLRLEVLALGGTSTRPEANCDLEPRIHRKAGLSTRGNKKLASSRQKKIPRSDDTVISSSGTPNLSNIVQEVVSLSHPLPKGEEECVSQEVVSYPFPTLWPAKDSISALTSLLPRKEEIKSYINSFQYRAKGCSFPQIPNLCTSIEIENYLHNVEHNALLHPDVLALIFAALALGLQQGIYDRCGERWVPRAGQEELVKGDVFIAASMQSLRLASFMSRPTVSVVQTLIMIGPYLTNAGKMLDAWALFGITIRLAQAIGLHRDPSHLYPHSPSIDVNVRRTLWWWILHMDQQYAVTLGRPLGISSIGDCPTPLPFRKSFQADSISNHYSQFSILARQILSAPHLCNSQIDQFTGSLLALRSSLPEALQFQPNWIINDTRIPEWPINAQAASLHQKTHNFVIFLNRQRVETNRLNVNSHKSQANDSDKTSRLLRGRGLVLDSCHEILHAFEFFKCRVRAGLSSWTICQQAFNAVSILITAVTEYKAMEHYPAIHKTYETFREIQSLGIHALAGEAIVRIQSLLNNPKSRQQGAEKFMSNQGMVLLEYAGQNDTRSYRFAPLRFDIANGGDEVITINIPEDGGKQEYPEDEGKQEYSHNKSAKKSKQVVVNGNASKHKYAIKKPQRKDSTPQRRPSSGAWILGNLQANLVDVVSPSITSNNYASKVSSVDIQSSLENPTHNGDPEFGTTSHLTCDLSTAPASSIDLSSDEPRTIRHASIQTPANLDFCGTSKIPVSTPEAFQSRSCFQANLSRLPLSDLAESSRPPSLHLSSNQSSYANSFVSLQTTSALHTPGVSNPVSPSLSHSQQYCLSQPQTQPQSPVWEVDFENPYGSTDLSAGVGSEIRSRLEVEEGKIWWAQGWHQ